MSPETSLTPPLILVVEDCPETIPALEIALLKTFACDVEHHVSGLQALAVFQLHPGSVLALITDLNLPEIDGWEIIRRVRAHPAGEHLPILAVSADPHPLAARNALLAGAHAFFSKPYSPLDVCRRLQGILDAQALSAPAPVSSAGEPARPTNYATSHAGDVDPSAEPAGEA